jgi:hypothetical protein
VADVDFPVRHGYTLGQLNELALAAVRVDRLSAMPIAHRRDIAWSAIAEHLVTAAEPPTTRELVRTGWTAITTHVRDGLRERGYRQADWGNPDPNMPRFTAFWATRGAPSLEERVTDHLAAQQILGMLTDVQRDAVVALATHDDYPAAARALGIPESTLSSRLGAARRAFVAWWHEGETPVQHRIGRRPARTDQLATHCGNGHEWTPENTRWKSRGRGKTGRVRNCRACDLDGFHRRKRALA